MRYNEYARRKYTLGEGANRRKKGASRPAAKREPSRWISGMDSCQFARPRARAPPLFFSSLRLASPRFVSSPARAGAGTLTPVFLFDKRILLEAIFTVSAAARNVVFVLNEIMILAITRWSSFSANECTLFTICVHVADTPLCAIEFSVEETCIHEMKAKRSRSQSREPSGEH